MKSMHYLDIREEMVYSPCCTTLLPQIMHYKNLSTNKQEQKKKTKTKKLLLKVPLTKIFINCVYIPHDVK